VLRRRVAPVVLLVALVARGGDDGDGTPPEGDAGAVRAALSPARVGQRGPRRHQHGHGHRPARHDARRQRLRPLQLVRRRHVRRGLLGGRGLRARRHGRSRPPAQRGGRALRLRGRDVQARRPGGRDLRRLGLPPRRPRRPAVLRGARHARARAAPPVPDALPRPRPAPRRSARQHRLRHAPRDRRRVHELDGRPSARPRHGGLFVLPFRAFAWTAGGDARVALVRPPAD
jgi:hypothetical protein